MFVKTHCKALLLGLLALGLSASLIYSYSPSLACSEHQTQQEGKQPETAGHTSPNGDQQTPPTTETAPAPSQPQDQAPSQSDTSKPDALQQGKILLETRCSTCHPAPRPSTHTISEWPPVLKRMGAMASLKDTEIQLIQQYLEDALKETQPQSEWDQPQG